MSTTTWTRSPNARLAMRKLGPLLMDLLLWMIFRRAELPTIPTTNTSRETPVLTYLKAPRIRADLEHIGGGGGGPPTTEPLDSVRGGADGWSGWNGRAASPPPIGALPRQSRRGGSKRRSRGDVHIVDNLLDGGPGNVRASSLTERKILLISLEAFYRNSGVPARKKATQLISIRCRRPTRRAVPAYLWANKTDLKQ